MKKVLYILVSVLVFVVGLCVMFYPTLSNWLHEQTASYAITDYLTVASEKTTDEYDIEFAKARAYNATLTGNVQSFMEAQEDEAADIQNPDYWNTFDEVDGIMGIIQIPSISVTLPIYHGTDESALQKGTGHLEGSALPTGDIGNHTIITGHTGLPTAQLFTDLDDMEVGDRFYLFILDQVFSYEIKNIYVVLPSETENLVAQADRDLVTLVTCTPYGVNSHRLLLQGERIYDPLPEGLIASSDGETTVYNIDKPSVLKNLPVLIGVAVCLGVVFIVAVIIFIVKYRRKHENVENKELENEQKIE